MNTSRRFDNFALRVEEPAIGRYTVTLLESPMGATRPVPMPDLFDDALARWLVELQGGVIDANNAALLGQRLLNALLPQEKLRRAFIGSLAHAKRADLTLRLYIEIAQKCRLAILPWEYIYDEQDGFYCLQRDVALVRNVPRDVPHREVVLVPFPSTMLIIASQPRNAQPLDVVAEVKGLVGAIAEHITGKSFKVDLLFGGLTSERVRLQEAIAKWREQKLEIHLLPEQASLDGVAVALGRCRYDFVHYIGHSTPWERKPALGLVDGEHGHTVDWVTDRTLKPYLREHVATYVLSSTNAAPADTARVLLGMAQSLLAADIPAVVAMQYQMTDRSVQRFAREFYGKLMIGIPIEQAVTEGRLAMHRASHNRFNWGTPALFLRSSNTVEAGQLDTSPVAIEKPYSSTVRDLRPPLSRHSKLLEAFGASRTQVATLSSNAQLLSEHKELHGAFPGRLPAPRGWCGASPRRRCPDTAL